MITGQIEYSDHGWISSPDDPTLPITGEASCDVVIVGGGYTGMAAALRLVEQGVDVVLLESEFCGYGASSRNAGHLTPTIAGDPQVLASVYKRRAPELIRLADHAVHFTESLLERLGIDCDYEPTGNVSAALTRGQHKRAQRIARTLEQCGGDVEFVEGPEWGLPDTFSGGIWERSGGLLNPGKLATGMRRAVLQSKARVCEGSRVEMIETQSNGVFVTTRGARVHAEKALIATNAYAHDLQAAPARVVAPLWVTLVETEPIAPDRLLETGWSRRSGIYTQHVILENYRPTVDGALVFGTRQVQAPKGQFGDRRPTPLVVSDLVRGLHDRFPGLSDVSIRRAWGGWIAMTPSWLPVVGEAAPNILYCLGYNGHGLAQAPYLGSLLADRLGGAGSHEDLQVLWRQRPRFAPAPLFSAPALKAGWAFDRFYDRINRGRKANGST